MSLFHGLALLGGFGAIGSFLLGLNASSRYSHKEQQLTANDWSWDPVFTAFVFLTIFTAPLAR